MDEFIKRQNELWNYIMINDKETVYMLLIKEKYEIDHIILLEMVKMGYEEMLKYILKIKEIFFTFEVERCEVMDYIRDEELKKMIMNIKINYY
jgi:hypothetical protein